MTKNSMNFQGKLLVITGGGSGIGRETALAFARRGAEVVLSDLNLVAAKETAAMIDDAGGTAHGYQLDVADEAAVRAHADEVAERHGVPDILINNAGIGQAGPFLGPFLATPSKSFTRVIDINLYGVVNGCRAFGEKMVKRGSGGHIVNLSSMAAYTPQQSFTAYSTSKAAVFMFSDCLRAELAKSGIGVSTICPGIVHTNIIANTQFSGVSGESEAEKQQKFDRLYAKRHYTPDKVAECIVAAVAKKKSIVPVTPEAHVGYHARRLVPALGRWLAARKDIVQ
jgi:NAD(P)-dependent dehydrogenase (short-subunit alcohol dehydrogenase family)